MLLQKPAVFVNDVHVAVHQAHLWVAIQGLDFNLQHLRIPSVVGVQEGQIFAVRMSVAKISRLRLSGVGLVEIGKFLSVLLDLLRRLIFGTVIHNYQFKISIGLSQHAVDRLTYEALAVEGGYDYAHFRHRSYSRGGHFTTDITLSIALVNFLMSPGRMCCRARM